MVSSFNDLVTTGTLRQIADGMHPLPFDSTGQAQFCESLADDGGCEGASVGIDWVTANATPPTDLIAKAGRNVSDRALTLSGTLKARVLSVGL